MSEAASLLAAIAAAPDDDGPRLVYADWLTSLGDPRGEFIVVQVALAKLGVVTVEEVVNAPLDVLSDADAARAGALLRRQTELLAEHQRTWLDALFEGEDAEDVARVTAWPSFRRGFVSKLSIVQQRDTALIARLAEKTDKEGFAPPIESIHILDDIEVDRLEAAHALDRVREIVIGTAFGQMVSALTFQRVVAIAPKVERIFDRQYGRGREFEPTGMHIEAVAGERLTHVSLRGLTPEIVLRASCMRTVTYLDLSTYYERALEFLNAAICPELREVYLSSGFDPGAVFDAAGSSALQSNPPPKLKKIRFEGARGESLANLIDSKLGRTLEEVTTDSGALTEHVAEVIMATPSITKANFGSTPIPSLAPFARRARGKSLETLGVRVEASIDESSLVAFLTQNPSLRSLRLGGPLEKPRHEGKLLAALARHAPPSLRSLSLGEWDLSNDDQVKALLASPQLANLRALKATHCAMGDGGACAVSEASMPNLVWIDLSTNGIGERGVQAFVRSKERFPGLAWLAIHVGSTQDGVKRGELKIVCPPETVLNTQAVADHLLTLTVEGEKILDVEVSRWDRDPWERMEAELIGRKRGENERRSFEIHIARHQDVRQIVIDYFLRERHVLRPTLEAIAEHLLKLAPPQSHVVDDVLDCAGGIGSERR